MARNFCFRKAFEIAFWLCNRRERQEISVFVTVDGSKFSILGWLVKIHCTVEALQP